MKYLTVSSCVKGEDDYIDDFVTIHRKLGVEHFIFWAREFDSMKSRFAGQDDITIINFPEPRRHVESYLECARSFQGFSKWTAFIDIDQVLFPVNKIDIKEVMKEFDQDLIGQVQFNWETFGSNGHLTKTDGNTYQRFTKRALSSEPISTHGQTVCDISKVIPNRLSDDPHRQMIMPQFISVDENFRSLGSTPFINPPSQNKMFIPHYYVRSAEEWKYKISKGRCDTGEFIDMGYFNDVDKIANVVEDTRVKDFWEKYCA